MLLLHGITTYSFIWDTLFDRLAQSHDVIALDLLGCGDSDMPLDVSYSLADHAERCARFLAELGLTGVHLVGHDLGGGIAQLLAVQHPGRLASVALVNTVAFDHWPVQPIIALRAPVIRSLLMASLDLGTFRLVVERGVYHQQRVTGAVMAQFQRPLETPEGRKGLLHFARCLDNSQLVALRPGLAQLTLPVLLIHGDADRYLSAQSSLELEQVIPGSRRVTMATAGHYIQLDEPDWLATQLLEHAGRVTPGND